MWACVFSTNMVQEHGAGLGGDFGQLSVLQENDRFFFTTGRPAPEQIAAAQLPSKAAVARHLHAAANEPQISTGDAAWAWATSPAAGGSSSTRPAADRLVSVVFDVTQQQAKHLLPRSVYAASADGRHALSFDLHRLERLHPGL